MKTMKKGIETHQWGYFQISDGKLIATCIANTYWEAIGYFEDELMVIDVRYEVRIIMKSE
jgi:hypothetical protein